MLTNFQLKRLKLKLDIVNIVEKPENRVHKLTDSNGAPCARIASPALAPTIYIIPLNLMQMSNLGLEVDNAIIECATDVPLEQTTRARLTLSPPPLSSLSLT